MSFVLPKISLSRILVGIVAVLLAGAGFAALEFFVHPLPTPAQLLARPAPKVSPAKVLTVPASTPSAPSYVQTGRLTILTRESPTTYYVTSNGPAGFEYDLASAFARYAGVKADFTVMKSEAEIVDAMEAGSFDLAAAGLARTPERERRVSFGPDYFSAEPQVVCRRSGPSCRSAIGLVKRRVVVAQGSYHEELLEGLRKRYPSFAWQALPGAMADGMADLLASGKADFAVMDSPVVAMQKRFHPDLAAAFSLADESQFAWVVRKGEQDLMTLLYQWMAEQKTQKLILTLREKYFGHLESLGYRDLTAFHRYVKTRLPQLKLKFQKAGRDTGLDWELLAAVAYQESQWDEDAVSPGGIKGLMMLTDNTAACVGVDNPFNADQSIRGGAKYLARLLRDVPSSVKGRENRLRFALAAYNIGPGHVRDARKLAVRLGKDPNNWRDIQQVLPLLSLEAYHKRLACGYARGAESVRYVRRVFSYREILANKSRPQRLPKTRLNAPSLMDAGSEESRAAGRAGRSQS